MLAGGGEMCMICNKVQSRNMDGVSGNGGKVSGGWVLIVWMGWAIKLTCGWIRRLQYTPVSASDVSVRFSIFFIKQKPKDIWTKFAWPRLTLHNLEPSKKSFASLFLPPTPLQPPLPREKFFPLAYRRYLYTNQNSGANALCSIASKGKRNCAEKLPKAVVAKPGCLRLYICNYTWERP